MSEWKVGDCALAKITKTAYAKVKVVKSEDGTFWGNKVIGFEPNGDGSFNAVEKLCYFVEICRTGDTMWIPASGLQLAERARPFYGQAKRVTEVPTCVHKKRKIKEDITISLNVEKVLNVVNPDKNTKYDHKHNPSVQHQLQGSFRDFVRRRLRLMCMLSQNTNNIKYSGEMNIGDDLSIENYYLKQNLKAFKKQHNLRSICLCKDKTLHEYLYKGWRFKSEMNRLVTVTSEEDEEKCLSDSNKSKIPVSKNEEHNGPSLPWCLVCGKSEDLNNCIKCPAAYHIYCAKEWFNTILHRKKLPENIDNTYALRKQVSSTRSIKVEQQNTSTLKLCPSCRWGPLVCYGDIVWQKMKSCPWWPAKILYPGFLPSCLVTNRRQSNEWPVQYYGSKNHSWCEQNSVVLFLPQQTSVLLANRNEISMERYTAIMDACDDYVSVYLT